MSESKHTPGPWEAIGNLVRSPMSTDEETGGSGGGFLLAEVYGIELTKYTEEAKANSRLIAAAPDLLEACRAALELEHCDCLKESYIRCVDCMNRMTQIDAAIAKATGVAATVG